MIQEKSWPMRIDPVEIEETVRSGTFGGGDTRSGEKSSFLEESTSADMFSLLCCVWPMWQGMLGQRP